MAWLLARRDFWGKSVLDALIHLPLVLPPVVTGYLLLLTFGRRGLVGAWLADHLGIVFAFRWTGAALACGVMSFPLLVRPIRLSIEAVDRRLEQAAGTLGAAPWRVFLTITLPLALPGVLAGMVLGFAKAIGEFGATITFVSNIPGETQTISSAIYSLIQTPDGDTAALRLVVVSIVIALARADRLRMVRAARHPAPARELIMLRVDVIKQLGEFSIEACVRQRGPRHRPVRRLGRRQDLADQHDRGLAAARSRHHRHRRRNAGRHRGAHPRPGASPPHRLCVPGCPAVSASRCAAKSRLRPAHEPPCRRSRATHARHRSARHRRPAGSPSRSTVRRRAPARRARTRAVVEAEIAAAGRAAGIAGRGAQGGDPALSGAAARRGQRTHGLCQPRRRARCASWRPRS